GASFTTRANAFTRAGYTFSGWNTAADGGGSAYAANTSIVNSFSANTTLYAQWTASTNTAYKVEHYKVSSTGKVTLAATQNLKGTTAAKVTAQARSFTGFTQGTKHRLRVATGTISANGTLTLKLYYKVNSYTITYAPNGATGTSVKQTVYYGESFKVRAASTFKRPGYTFSSWNTQAKGGGTTF
ncbi:MAG: InlB B-repeat-containing protein, partial [Coriobacteriia bacterium]|nr:InlB B-repeat-containing protein [Coriobacteriia bacterium]